MHMHFLLVRLAGPWSRRSASRPQRMAPVVARLEVLGKKMNAIGARLGLESHEHSALSRVQAEIRSIPSCKRLHPCHQSESP